MKRIDPVGSLHIKESKIDFTAPFDSQIPALTEAFDAAKELKDLIPWLKLS